MTGSLGREGTHETVSQSDRRGRPLRTAHLAPDLFPPGELDPIRLSHALEHPNGPVEYLGQIAAWLAPGGVLYAEAPNIETCCRTKSRGRMFRHAHIYNFNPWTLRACAGLAGLAEAPETAQRSAGATGVFFRRDTGAAARKGTENPENARHVRDPIRRRYAGAFARRKAARPLNKPAMRIEESLAGPAAGGPRGIGERAMRRLRQGA